MGLPPVGPFGYGGMVSLRGTLRRRFGESWPIDRVAIGPPGAEDETWAGRAYLKRGRQMATFFMFGRYSSQAAEQISAERTEKVRKLIEELGGRVKDIYVLLGEYDVVIIAELPRMAEAMQASIALKRLTDISFFTAAAMPIDEFDELAENL